MNLHVHNRSLLTAIFTPDEYVNLRVNDCSLVIGVFAPQVTEDLEKTKMDLEERGTSMTDGGQCLSSVQTVTFSHLLFQ